jgi:hypothetical protein
MKVRVDKSMGILIHIAETLTRIKPTESLRLDKCKTRKKRNYSDSSGNFPTKILVSRPFSLLVFVLTIPSDLNFKLRLDSILDRCLWTMS